MCHRYYEAGPSTGAGTFFRGDVTSGASYTFQRGLVEKRTLPTITLTNLNNFRFPAAVGSTFIARNGFSETRVANATGGGAFFICSFTASAEL